jgi:hypothetical protein
MVTMINLEWRKESGVLLHSRLTIEIGNMLYVSKSKKKGIYNIFHFVEIINV